MTKKLEGITAAIMGAGDVGDCFGGRLAANAQQLCASRTRYWLEYVHCAEPILARPLAIWIGLALPPARPGSSIDWLEAAVRRILAD